MLGIYRKNCNKKFQKKISASDKIVEELSVAVEGQKKGIANNSGLLKDLLIGTENLGDTLKGINKEMDYWRNPKVQAAQQEYAELEEQLLTEVPPPNHVSIGPIGASIPPKPQHQYLAQRPNIFPVAGLGNFPTNAIWTEEVEASALKKPYPRTPISVGQGVPVCKGFDFGSVGQPTMPQFFTMGSSTSLGLSLPDVNVKIGAKSAPRTNPDPKGNQVGIILNC